jgi:hypothetical protein
MNDGRATNLPDVQKASQKRDETVRDVPES